MKGWTDERGVNLSWKQQPERLRSLYLWRVTNYVVLAWQCALLGAEVFLFRNPLGVIPVIAAIVIMLWAVRRNARRITSARRDPPRPDYSRIAAMEREIFGEAFTHDGAPVAEAPRPGLGLRSAQIGHRDGEMDHHGRPTCLPCEEQRTRAGFSLPGVTMQEFGEGMAVFQQAVTQAFGIPSASIGGTGAGGNVTVTYGGAIPAAGGGGGTGTGTGIVRCGYCERPLSLCGGSTARLDPWTPSPPPSPT